MIRTAISYQALLAFLFTGKKFLSWREAQVTDVTPRLSNAEPALECYARKRSAVGLAFLATVLAGCTGYMPGRQAHWDTQVKEMCKKDGGITIYETVQLTEEEYRRLGGGIYGGLPIPVLTNVDRPDYPYFRERAETRIRESNPEVVRTQELMKRRSDGKILARSIHYSRRGGDLPTGLAHETSFSCPEATQLSKEVFKVREKK